MIKYSEVDGLPKDHPKMIQFMKEQNDMEIAYSNTSAMELDDEDSLEYFNHYVAGDR